MDKNVKIKKIEQKINTKNYECILDEKNLDKFDSVNI